jgi:hypothetical protein
MDVSTVSQGSGGGVLAFAVLKIIEKIPIFNNKKLTKDKVELLISKQKDICSEKFRVELKETRIEINAKLDSFNEKLDTFLLGLSRDT